MIPRDDHNVPVRIESLDQVNNLILEKGQRIPVAVEKSLPMLPRIRMAAISLDHRAIALVFLGIVVVKMAGYQKHDIEPRLGRASARHSLKPAQHAAISVGPFAFEGHMDFVER